ncbi:hypothetical protein N657DRAFT_579904 [Parathielavia appendiculata]|uniref:Cyanovirin-N domain-containing protein n=1 Tax=Parathielavia appendiculata TaxID=2587402 RepID=A0AAN6Z0G8_9PEZI|nr:hypothetical protein N657DRAFT_579904 [Parathielavia appendiculata]
MKLVTLLTFLLGTATALESAGLHRRAERPTKRALRVKISTPTLQQSKASLVKVSGLEQRSGSRLTDVFAPGQNPSLSTADCKAIVSQLLSTDGAFIIAANSCLVFELGTCQGFFCSVCEELTTSTLFIGSQLDTVDALCVENGQAGTIVGDEAPQWDAGFTYAGAGLPTFDIC